MILCSLCVAEAFHAGRADAIPGRAEPPSCACAHLPVEPQGILNPFLEAQAYRCRAPVDAGEASCRHSGDASGGEIGVWAQCTPASQSLPHSQAFQVFAPGGRRAEVAGLAALSTFLRGHQSTQGLWGVQDVSTQGKG